MRCQESVRLKTENLLGQKDIKFQSKLIDLNGMEEVIVNRRSDLGGGNFFFCRGSAFIMLNYRAIIYHLSGATTASLFVCWFSRTRFGSSLYELRTGSLPFLFIFSHKICQQIRDDCPLQGRRGCIKLIRKDKGGQRAESQQSSLYWNKWVMLFAVYARLLLWMSVRDENASDRI